MKMPSSKQKSALKFLILIVLSVFKSVVLQIIGIKLITVFICLGFYYLGYLLFGIISLILVVGV